MPASLRATCATVALSASMLLGGCPKPIPPRVVTADAGQVPIAVSDGGDACDQLSAEDRNTVLAVVGESRLTVCDFVRRLSAQNPYLRARMSTPEARRALIRAWVDSEALALEARTRHMDQEPAVRNAIYAQLARQVEAEVRGGVPAPTVTEADVEQYYREHLSEYESPEQVRFSHIVLLSRPEADRVLAEARAVSTDDAAWRQLVLRNTRDNTTRDTGGDLGFVSREGSAAVAHEVAEAAFLLRNVGEVATSVVESAHGAPSHARGFHVIRLIARREALRRPLDDVRRAIRNRLFEQRLDQAQAAAVAALIARLRSGTTVQVDPAVLSSVRIELAGSTAPAMAAPGLGRPLLPPGVALPAAGAPPR